MICVGLELSYWCEVKAGLQQALDVDANKYSLDDLLDAIKKQEMQLWCIHDGAILAAWVTQIINYPQKKVLDCVALTGINPQAWLGFLLENMETYAKNNDCDIMQAGGRKGWERMFKQYGWGNTHIKMSRSINYAK